MKGFGDTTAALLHLQLHCDTSAESAAFLAKRAARIAFSTRIGVHSYFARLLQLKAEAHEQCPRLPRPCHRAKRSSGKSPNVTFGRRPDPAATAHPRERPNTLASIPSVFARCATSCRVTPMPS